MNTLGPYRILGSVAEGGMGRVWRARSPDGTVVAVKSVPTSNPGRRAALRRELALLSSLRHPGVVRLLDLGDGEEGPWYAMELLDHPSLAMWLSMHRPDAVLLDEPTLADDHTAVSEAIGPASDPRALLELAEALARTLAFLHGEGLVHGDLKPSNVMVVDGRPVLVDFGLAERVGSAEAGAGGSAPWMAPERILGDRIDGRADLYALGVILYEGLTGERPFRGPDVAAVLRRHLHDAPVPPRAPAPVAELVMELLHKRPGDRPGWALDVADRLASYLNRPSSSPPPRWHLLHGPLVGRSQVQDAVHSALDQGTGRVIVGPPGTGRTAVLAAAARHARHQGAVVFSVHAAGPAPLSALREVLPTLLDHAGAELGPDHVAGQWLRAQSRAEASPVALPPGSAGAVRAVLDGWLAKVPAPVVWVADDLDQVDALSHAWLCSLLRHAPAGVSAVAAGSEAVEGVPTIELAPLGRGLAGDVLDGMLGTQAPEPLRSVILDAAAGRPARIAQRLQSLVRERVLDRAEGSWRWPEAPALTEAGHGWSAEAQARLPAGSAAVLGALAVLGSGTAAEIASVAGVPPTEVEAALPALLGDGWAHPRGAQIHMAGTLRDGVRARQDPTVQRSLAARACEVLADDGRRIADRAALLELAGDLTAAGRAWWQAGQEAHALSDLGAAGRAWDRAAQLLPEHRAFLTIFRATYVSLELGHHEAVEAELRALLAGSLGAFDRQAALCGLGRLLWRTGRSDEAETCFRERLAATADNALQRSITLADLGSLMHERGDLEQALALEQAAVDALDEVQEGEIGPQAPLTRPSSEHVAVNRAVFLSNVGTALLGLRRRDEALAVLERASALADELPDWRVRLLPLRGTHAVALLRMGKHAEARPRFERVLADAQASGDTLNECVTWQFLGRLALVMGEDPEPWVAPGLHVAEARGYVMQQGTLWAIRAERYEQIGAWSEADHAARESERLARVSKGHAYLMHALCLQSAVARARGDLAHAQSCLDAAAEHRTQPAAFVQWAAERGLVAAAAGDDPAPWLTEAEAAAADLALRPRNQALLEELRTIVARRAP